MESSSIARKASKAGILALAAILVFGSASVAVAQGNGGNPLNALWAAIGDIQVQLDSLAAGNTDLQALIDAEADARAAADTTLQSNIDAEEAARVAADTTLQANIDAEAAARMAADSTLQQNIGAEEAARVAADAILQNNIDAEQAARMAADNALQNQINGIHPGILKGFYQTKTFSQTVGPGGIADFGGIQHCTNPDDRAINFGITGHTTDDTVVAGYIPIWNTPSGNGWFLLIKNAEDKTAEFNIRLLCADIT